MRPASTFSFIQLSNTRAVLLFDNAPEWGYNPIFDSCMEKKTL